MVALFENSYQRWKYCADQEKAGEPVVRKHKDWDTKYTNLRGGQKMFGGWEAEGRKRIKELTSMIAQNRVVNIEERLPGLRSGISDVGLDRPKCQTT